MSKGGRECETVDRTRRGCGSVIVWRECEAAARAGMRWLAKGERVRSRTMVWLALECNSSCSSCCNSTFRMFRIAYVYTVYEAKNRLIFLFRVCYFK